jgi:hypothetical protein
MMSESRRTQSGLFILDRRWQVIEINDVYSHGQTIRGGFACEEKFLQTPAN